MSETYIVTGGAGFIGSHITERLLKDGHAVRVVDNLSTGRRSNLEHFAPELQARLSVHETTITDKPALDKIFAGADYVFHEAALVSVPQSVEDPLKAHEDCVTGTLNVLLAARDAGVKRVVYAASSAAYGDVEGYEAEVETIAPAPKSPYGAAKLMGEYYCRVFAQVYNLETVCLRYFNVFGPRQDPKSLYAAVIPIFIARMVKGEAPTIFGDGLQSRDFTYIDNVVHGNLLAVKAPHVSGQVMNLATGDDTNLLQLIEKLNKALGTSFEPVHQAERVGDIKHSKADISKAQELLNYEPIIDFDFGIEQTVEWFKKNG